MVTGRRQNHAGLVRTRRTLRNQILRTAGFLRRVFRPRRSRAGLLAAQSEMLFQQFRHRYVGQ